MRIRCRLLSLLLVGAAVGGGLLYGHALGSHGQGRGARVRAGLLLPFARPTLDDLSTSQQPDETVPPANVFEDVLDHVQKEFVETNSAGSRRLSSAALARMFASLDDPRTLYLDPILREAREQALLGHFHGIGAALAVTETHHADIDRRHLTVVDVMPGSPAERAGLRTGDSITGIDGHWIIAYSALVQQEQSGSGAEPDAGPSRQARAVTTRFQRGYSLAAALPRLLAGSKTPLTLRIERSGVERPIDVRLTTAATEVDPVSYRLLPNGVGLLCVRQFNLRAAQAIRHLLPSSRRAARAFVVDLRGDPGGVRARAGDSADGMEAVKALLEQFTNGGVAAVLETRPGNAKQAPHREPLVIPAPAQPFRAPTAVLVDAGTANLAEVAAAALANLGGAKTVGRRTFGDDTVAFFSGLPDGGGVEMTSALLLSGRGNRLKGGLAPDIPVAGEGDAALQHALALLDSKGQQP